MRWFLPLIFAAVILFALAGCTFESDNEEDADDADPTPDDDDDNDNDNDDDDTTSDDVEWWRRVVFMEIYVRSYFDSDADGIGDLPGLTQKLPYLADLGIGGLWLMPIYPTPFADSGYDIADYTAVNPEYGTMADFQAFLARAHELGIRVFLDGVFNHTSDEHPWFVESRSSRDNPKRDWCLWGDEPLFQCPDSPPGGAVELAWTYE